MQRAVVGLALLLLVPLGPASAVTGATVGLARGGVGVEVWDVWLITTSGLPWLELTWRGGPLDPVTGGADYDLHFYGSAALADGMLEPHELIKTAETRGTSPQRETLDPGVPPGTYPIAVVPHKAQAEGYTLLAEGGSLVAWGRLVVPHCPVQDPCR